MATCILFATFVYSPTIRKRKVDVTGRGGTERARRVSENKLRPSVSNSKHIFPKQIDENRKYFITTREKKLSNFFFSLSISPRSDRAFRNGNDKILLGHRSGYIMHISCFFSLRISCFDKSAIAKAGQSRPKIRFQCIRTASGLSWSDTRAPVIALKCPCSACFHDNAVRQYANLVAQRRIFSTFSHSTFFTELMAVFDAFFFGWHRNQAANIFAALLAVSIRRLHFIFRRTQCPVFTRRILMFAKWLRACNKTYAFSLKLVYWFAFSFTHFDTSFRRFSRRNQ